MRNGYEVIYVVLLELGKPNSMTGFGILNQIKSGLVLIAADLGHRSTIEIQFCNSRATLLAK